MAPTVFAFSCHPDDIEFYMAGTLVLLGNAGYETHYFCLASGNCGSVQYNSARTRAVRAAEAREGARVLGATFHPAVTDDLESALSLRIPVQIVPPGSLPRFEMKARRVVHQR